MSEAIREEGFHLEDRIKTTIRVPYAVLQQAEEVAASVGMGKNAFFAIAAAKLVCELAGKHGAGAKRKTAIKALQREINKIFETALQNS